MVTDEGGGLPPELDAELGRMAAALDAEVRAEQAEFEREAARAAQRRRRLGDLARDWMLRGDTVEVRVAGAVLTGHVIQAGTDLITLETALRGQVDVALGAGPVLRVVHRDPAAEAEPGRGPRTLAARLTGLEVEGAQVVLVLLDGTEVSGRVQAVAADHVLLDSPRGEQAVPLSRIALRW